MVSTIFLDGIQIPVTSYKQEKENGLSRISVIFQVSSERYHEITTLLYKGEFDIHVPETELLFKGKIQEYWTSITNLYEAGQVGEFHLSLLEIY
jgi:hypothetical protein